MLDLSEDLIPLHGLLTGTLDRVRVRFDEQIRSELPPVQRLCSHIEQYRGKMIRPALVVLSGLAVEPSDTVSHEHVTIGAVCEMVHMATLVHDDVLDDAETRRGGDSVNSLCGNEAAVILGDYLFSAAYHLCSGLPASTAALLIAETGMTLCSGELLQLHHRGNYSIDEQTYFEIVERKTASLIAVACRLGSSQAGADAELADRLARFGLRLGVAFQIQDDLLDLLGSARVTGKPVRRDIELGKLTLPLIHHLATAPAKRRGATLSLLEQGSLAIGDELSTALQSTGSIEHARQTAHDLVDQAKADLDGLADTPARQYLLRMAGAVIERTH